jgi:S-adenosylmethionine-dependent methyltransferase
VRISMERAGATRSAWYGVRLFTDHYGAAETSPDFVAILAAETEAGRRDPYRSVAALTHTIAVRVTGLGARN